MKRKAEWIAARDAHLKLHPSCERCGIQDDTIVVHHKKGGGMAYRDHSAENLESLCFKCHTKEHNPRDKDFRKGEKR